MMRRRTTPAALLAGLALASLAATLPAQPGKAFPPFDRAAFTQWLREHGGDDAVVQRFLADATELGDAAASETALRAVSPDYDKALKLAESDDPRAALALAQIVAGDDPQLRAHARYWLGRVFTASDDPERAAEILAELLAEDRGRTPHDAEALFFYGVALAETPKPDEATEAFQTFLDAFPDAPERYRTAAAQQVAELEARRGNPLHEVADVMQGVEHRIRRADTGEETQRRQKEAVAKLQEILEKIEEQEKQSGGVGGLTPPTSPASHSALSPGATRVGDLRRASTLVDRWGQMKDLDRKAIETDLQTKLPAHYRRMLEDYYKKLGTGDGR